MSCCRHPDECDYAIPASDSQIFCTPSELVELRDGGAIILDARSQVDEFIPGAVHAPWPSFVTGPKSGVLQSTEAVQAKLRGMSMMTCGNAGTRYILRPVTTPATPRQRSG
jgi:hypothetical protein